MYPTDAAFAQQSAPVLTCHGLISDVIELLIFWIVLSPLPFIMIEKTILSIMRMEEEQKRERNGVRPYVEPLPPRTLRSAGSAGNKNNNNHIISNNSNKVVSSFSLENEDQANGT